MLLSVGVADGGWHGAYKWSNKPPPLARKMPSRLFKYLWASLASKEGALSKKPISNTRRKKLSLEVPPLKYWEQLGSDNNITKLQLMLVTHGFRKEPIK